MKHNQVEFLAYKIHEENEGLDSDACWKKAEEALRIFPDDVIKVNNYLLNGRSYTINRDIYDYAVTWNVGLFSLSKFGESVTFEKCRELFEIYYTVTQMHISGKSTHIDGISYNHYIAPLLKDGFYFWCPKSTYNKSLNVVQNTANFLRHVESDILKLSDLSTFKSTTLENCLWIRVSDFWKQETIRISLLTILLRCGIHYENSDIPMDTVFNKYDYSRNTKLAINAFFNGRRNLKCQHSFTTYKNWNSLFANKDDVYIQSLLA